MEKLKLILLVLFFWLQYSLWLGKNGVHDLIRIKNEISIQKSNNTKLKVRNDKLFAEINNLNNNEVIEERSRNELIMIKPGETFYRLISKDK